MLAAYSGQMLSNKLLIINNLLNPSRLSDNAAKINYVSKFKA